MAAAVLKTETVSPWLDTEGAASYIGCTAGTLKTWRCQGCGPRYHHINNRLVRYHVEELDDFVRKGNAHDAA